MRPTPRIAVSIMFFINGFLYANWVARLPRVQEVYGLDHGDLGIVLLMAAIGAFLAMPFAGWVITRQGSRRVTAVSALLLCMVVPLLAVFPDRYSLMAAFFGLGIMTGLMDVAMNAQAVEVESRKQKPIMATFHALFSAGMMLGAGSGALFTRLDSSLLLHFGVVSGLSLLLAGWGIRGLLVDPPQKTADSGPAFRLPDASLLGLGLIAFCSMLGEGAMADWSTNYLLKVTHSPEATAPLGLAAFSLAMMLGRFLGDWARNVWGDSRLLIFSGLLSVLGLGLTLGILQPWVGILGLFLVGLGLATVVPIAYSTAGRTPGISPGVGISMVTTIGYSGFLFGPPAIGFVADWMGLRVSLGMIFLLFVLMLGLSLNRAWQQKKAFSR
jgi:fucose permease